MIISLATNVTVLSILAALCLAEQFCILQNSKKNRHYSNIILN